MVFGIHVLGFKILIYVVLREILITLELLEYSFDICFYEYWFMSLRGIFTQVWSRDTRQIDFPQVDG